MDELAGCFIGLIVCVFLFAIALSAIAKAWDFFLDWLHIYGPHLIITIAIIIFIAAIIHQWNEDKPARIAKASQKKWEEEAKIQAEKQVVYERELETARQEQQRQLEQQQRMREEERQRLRNVDYSVALRLEHTLIVAPTGQGKSQLIESLVVNDLLTPLRAAIVVIDSKGDLIERIARISDFHIQDFPILLIDPADKPSLNLFDVPQDLVEKQFNEVASSMRYLFGAVFGNQLSNQMNVLFLPLLHMVLRKPGATLEDFVKIVENPFDFPELIEKVPRGPRNFITNQYNSKDYSVTRRALITRIHELINEVTLDDMFSAPKNAVDLRDAFNKGAVVLISTDRKSLQDLSPIIGKYWLSQIMNAALTPRENKRPVYLYLDECEPYVDDKLGEILTFMRSYGLGVTMAFQETGQMGSFMNRIMANTAIKFTSGLEPEDARRMASSMRIEEPAELMVGKHGQLGRYRLYYRGLQEPRYPDLTFGFLDRVQVDDITYKAFRHRNRMRLRITIEEPTETAPPPPQPEPKVQEADYEIVEPETPRKDLAKRPDPSRSTRQR